MGVDSKTITMVRKMVVDGTPPERSSKTEKAIYQRSKSPEWLAISTFIQALGNDMAKNSPDLRITELPSGSKQNYYEIFVEDWKSGVLDGTYFSRRATGEGEIPKPPSRSLFYKVWMDEYGG
jgi:hypothetical protein